MIADDEVQQWALTLMRTAGAHPLPLYGSPEFLRSNGLLRLASAVRAAEAWRHDADAHVLAAQLEAELQAEWRACERDYDGWRDQAERVRRTANAPTHDELQRRRSA